MGEIGRDRHEYLYEMSYCDILLIQRGYRRRNILQYQLQRLQAFGSFFCMSGTNKSPQDFIPLYIDRYIDDNYLPQLTEDEIKEMQDLMAAENSRLSQQKSSEE